MSTALTGESGLRKPLRLWPGVIAAILLCVLRFVVPPLAPGLTFYAAIGALVCSLAILVWWLFFSRAPWLERVGAVVLMVVALVVTWPFVHISIRTAMMGNMLPIYAIFVLTPALVAWAVATRNRSDGIRRISLIATLLLVSGTFTLLRTGGIRGGASDLAWRWSKTPEERLLAQTAIEPAATPQPAAAVTPSVTEASKAPAPTSTVDRPPLDSARVNPDEARKTPGAATPTPHAETRKATAPAAIESVSSRVEWPGFRGPGRDGVVHGVQINTDWTASPPVPLWHRQIGPGWSSFAVSGDLLYTQEQRGEDEIVACYRVGTGEPVWMHRDKVRFWESNGGAGPRATPTLSNGRVYAFGATGLLNVLSAANGAAIWARDVASDANKKVPMWGFSSSPLVIGDLVVVAASGKLVAYDIAGGKPRWFGPDRPGSYSSPQRVTIDGVEQILLLTAAGATSVALSDGALLWEHSWPEGTTIVQPAMTPDGDVLINSLTGTGGLGIRRLNVTHGSGGWTVTERWTSTGLKPYFNDFVVHKGHAYGFDGSILACIDLQDGKRKWKGGRYGDGQLVLLPDQDLLFVVSEEGELALVKATPDQFTEVARFKAVEGKTWNHPVVVRDFLLVRNGEEMAAFRLSLAGR
jgi:outer membrane protein assembly factor BamB